VGRGLLRVVWLAALAACASPPAGAPAASGAGSSAQLASPAAPALPDISTAVQGLRRLDGLLTVYADDALGRLLLELPPPHGPQAEVGSYLLLEGLRSGLGHNDVGLDRGQMGAARVVRLRRLARRVLLEQPNLGFRADQGDAEAQRAANESFAGSVLWAAPIEALAADGRALVDLSTLLLRDTHGIAATLAATGQGRFALDPNRSVLDLTAARALPDNLEFDALLTFSSEEPGPLVRATAAAPDSPTFVQHVSLVRLPDAGYQPLPLDPRIGAFALGYQDTNAPLTGGVERRLAVRHRLQLRDAADPRAGVVEPIVYYVDRGAPPDVRAALLEGASWWSAAFEAAGLPGAFRVELLPEGVDPLDVRYNVVQWVHRSTRGWSYGNAVTDPRTGEIVKGHVTLGSLRVRQDRLLFEGLLGTAHTGDGSAEDPLQLALARIRQLAAHEVGHTLGLAHNFAASRVFNGSVMDYPAPRLLLGSDDTLQPVPAYGTGVGPWDRAAIGWLYGGRPYSADDTREGTGPPIPYLSDDDARAPGTAHPGASLWDGGSDPVEALRETLAVRRWALQRFGPDRIAPGLPLSELEPVLATVYLHHRYQVEAAVKCLGGLEYEHALRDGAEHLVLPVDAGRQAAALDTLLALLAPDELELPEHVLRLVPPPLPDEPLGRERLGRTTGRTFDELASAASACHLVVDALLHRERAGRLVEQAHRDPGLPSLDDVLVALLEATLYVPGSLATGQPQPRPEPAEPRQQALVEVAQRAVVDGLLTLAADRTASAAVRASVCARLEGIARLGAGRSPHAAALRADIERFLTRPAPAEATPAGALPAPPGPPIGGRAPALPELAGCSLSDG